MADGEQRVWIILRNRGPRESMVWQLLCRMKGEARYESYHEALEADGEATTSALRVWIVGTHDVGANDVVVDSLCLSSVSSHVLLPSRLVVKVVTEEENYPSPNCLLIAKISRACPTKYLSYHL